MGEWITKFETKIPKLRLEQLCGCSYWKMLFQSCIPDPILDGHFGVGNTHAFLLYGPVGCGRTTLALACAGNMGEAGYRFLYLDGNTRKARQEEENARVLGELFQEIQGEICDPGQGCFLFLEDAEPFLEDAGAACVLEREFRVMEEKNSAFTMMAAVESAANVPPFLKTCMLPCRIRRPDENERRLYLENVFEGRIPRASGLSYEWMTERTEGFTYQNMSDLSRLAAMMLKQKALWYYKDRKEQMVQALETGAVRLTRELFSEITEQLKSEKTEWENRKDPIIIPREGQVSAGKEEGSEEKEREQEEKPKGIMESLLDMNDL